MGNKQNKNNKKGKNINNDNEEENIFYLRRNIRITPLLNYKHFGRKDRYYSEKMEISDSEQNRISSLSPEKIPLIEFPPIEGNNKIKVIIDTDLGTDWDDAMAIMYALNLPNIDILGITTNYGIPKLRASVVQKILDAYEKLNPDKHKIPVIAGASRPLGTHRNLMIYGHEGLPFFETKELIKWLKMDNIMNQEQDNAAKFILDQVKKYPYEVKIISIGIPTNIGLALNNYKEIIPLIKEIVIMGCGSALEKPLQDYDALQDIKNGKIISLYPNHNISGDTLASKILFDSKVPTKIVSHTVSSKFWSHGPVIF